MGLEGPGVLTPSIVVLVKDLRVNGANRVILEVATGLAQLGWDVTVSVEDASHRQWLGRPLRILPRDDALKRSFDVALSTFYTTVFDLDRVSASARWQYFQDNYYRYGSRTDERLDQIEYAYMHRGSGKLAVSHYLSGLLRAKGVDATVVQPGVDHGLFAPPGHRTPFAKRALVEGHRRSYKALPDTYAAIPEGWERWGLGLDDHRLGASTMNVQVPQNRIKDIYGACDVLVKLERGGGHPLPPLEAMACGTPVPVSDEGGHLDYCVDEFNALVVTGPEEGRDRLARLAADESLRTRLAANGVAVAASRSWDRTVRAFDHVIRKES